MTTTYSQPATKQDLWVADRLGLEQRPAADSYYSPGHGGYFVEIGAHDGVRHSNTKLLEDRYDWKGLLVEANPQLFDKLKVNRPRAIASQDVVGAADGDEVYFIYGEHGSTAFGGIKKYMPDDWVHEHKKRQSPGEERRTKSLETLLKETEMPYVIDYLSLDVEGAELAILDGYFCGPTTSCRHAFNIITVEFRYDKFLLDQLTEVLRPIYTLEHIEAFDAFFVRQQMIGPGHLLRKAA